MPFVYNTLIISFLYYDPATIVSSYTYLPQIAMHVIEAVVILHLCARYRISLYTWLQDLVV